MATRYAVYDCPHGHPIPVEISEAESHEHDENGWCWYCGDCRRYWSCESMGLDEPAKGEE